MGLIYAMWAMHFYFYVYPLVLIKTVKNSYKQA